MDLGGRLQHLWNLSKGCTDEAMSRWYRRQMMRMAEASDDGAMKLGDGFYENVCSCCGSLFVPMVNCRVRLHRLAAVRNHCNSLLMSRVMLSAGPSDTKDCICLSYFCFICARLTVFDNAQTSVAEDFKDKEESASIVKDPEEKSAVKPTMDAAKLQRLQKILNKQRNSSLGSFLQSTRKS